MRKLLLSVILTGSLLFISTFAEAWHIEVDLGLSFVTNGSITGGTDNVRVEENVRTTTAAEWKYLGYTVGPSSIIPDWDIIIGGGSDSAIARLAFTIVSDVGDLSVTPITAAVNGYVQANLEVVPFGAGSELFEDYSVAAASEGTGVSHLGVMNALAIEPTLFDSDLIVADPTTLMTNTPYQFDLLFYTYVEWVDFLLPSEFADEAEKDAWLAQYGAMGGIDITASAEGDWDINIDGTERPPGPDPIPEPGTMLLLGVGLIGLAGVTRKKSKT